MDKEKMPAPAAKEATPLLSGPKRHHFLPRFYLEGFSRDGLVSLYDRDTDEYRRQQPINTGVIGHFYTFEDAQGRKRFELEKHLSEVEGLASAVMRKLTAKEEISTDERAALAVFVALAAFRTPDHIDSLKHVNGELVKKLSKFYMSDISSIKEHLRKQEEAPTSEEELEKQARAMMDFVQEGDFTVETDHQWAVGMAVSHAASVAEILVDRHWDVIHRDGDKRSFITCDSPVLLTTIAPRPKSIFHMGVGFGNRDALVVFPLSETCALRIYGEGDTLRHTKVDQNLMRRVNLSLAAKSQRYVIGRDVALVKSLVERAGLANKQWHPKMKMS